jgi:hypothetical protein
MFVGATYGNVIDPDQVSLIESDGITTPDVLGVDVGDSDVPMISQSAGIPMKPPCLNQRQG